MGLFKRKKPEPETLEELANSLDRSETPEVKIESYFSFRDNWPEYGSYVVVMNHKGRIIEKFEYDFTSELPESDVHLNGEFVAKVIETDLEMLKDIEKAVHTLKSKGIRTNIDPRKLLTSYLENIKRVIEYTK